MSLLDYDPFTDSQHPLDPEDLGVLRAVFRAYSRVRTVRMNWPSGELPHRLDEIHSDLKEEVEELQDADRSS